MATMTDVVRRIQIQASETGADQTSASLLKLAGAQDAVAVATTNTEKATISVQGKLNSLMRTIDAEYASEMKLAAAEKTIAAARNQGLISITRQNELLDLASTKYRTTGESAKVMAEGLATAKEVAMGLVAGLGAGLLLTGLAEVPAKIRESVEAVADIKDTAETVGIAAKNLQELDYAASQTGVSTDTLNGALEKFSKNLGVAATGTGELYKVLKANHVEITGDVMKDFENYANLVQGATNAEQRNYLVTAAFGKGASDLGRIFNGGADGIKRLADEAENAGAILSDDTLASAKELDDEFASMQKQLDVAFEGFMVNIAPALVVALGTITDAVKIANAAVEAGKWGIEQAMPVADRSTAHLETDLATQKALLARAAPGTIASSPMRVHVGPQQTASIQTQIDADTAELNHRNAAALGGWVDTNSANGGWGSLPPATKSPPPPPNSTAAKQAADIKKVTDALNLQIKALTETNRQKEIDDELAKAHVSASSKEGQAITDLAGKYYDEKTAIDQANQAAGFLAQTGESAIESLIDGSASAADAIGNITKAIEQAVIQAALLGSGPLANIFGGAPTTSGGTGGILGGLLSSLHLGTNALGGVYSSPDLSSYRNQVVDHPTLFGFASGGVFGEAGPEAIMPLSRGPDGRLGVSAPGNDNGLEVNVQIVHQPGASDSATAKKDGNKLNLVALVGDAASQSLKTPGSSMNRALRVGFGARPQLTRRGG